MNRPFSWPWVQTQVARTAEAWLDCPAQRIPDARRFTPGEQRLREAAYDQALRDVERESQRVRRARNRAGAPQRVTASFARFAATALDLDDDAIALLTGDFLPVGTSLARWARRFDPALSMGAIVQACRNAWTACGLQPLLGQPLQLTPGILAYSLLYPYSDNSLDDETLSTAARLRFSRRFRDRLCGQAPPADGDRERAVWALVGLIEDEYPRDRCPQIFDALLAIHRAQEHSLRQVHCGPGCPTEELLRLSCAKGGTSVLADACLAQPWLSDAESRFAFDWGVLLQLGDDLQDIREDAQRGSMTLFSSAAARGERLDALTIRLLTFADVLGTDMEGLPHGTSVLKNLLRMSWRSLILMAVAESHQYFSPEFLREAEEQSPFRFAFLRERRTRVAGRRGLYATLFGLFLEYGAETGDLPLAAPPVELAVDVA